MRIYFMVCILLVYSDYFLEGKMYQGSVTFKQKWADFRVTPGSSQYRVMVENIENSIREAFKNDSNFRNVKVTQLREHEATKKSTRLGNFTADFELSFNNESRVKHSITNLFSMVQDGALDGIPVQEGSLVIHAAPQIPIIWPTGSYGLPKPKSGCPNKDWREGFRYQDSENLENTNVKSNNSHLSGPVSSHGVRQEFCLHMDTGGEIIPWPHGKYCIYRKGKTCPTGLKGGWVRWDDENTKMDYPNSLGGELPDGIYGENTAIYFCCSTSGKKSVPISLPYGSPFYLIAYGSPRCQQVKYHKVTSEYLQFDDEDQANTNAHTQIAPYGPAEDKYNNRIYYCYYEPIPCDAMTDPACPSQALAAKKIPDEVQVINITSDREGIVMSENNEQVVTQKATQASKFATGSGVGMIIMGSALVAVFAKRFLNTRERASWTVENQETRSCIFGR